MRKAIKLIDYRLDKERTTAMELVNVSPPVLSNDLSPPLPSAHYGFRLHLLLQSCSTLHVPVAQIGLQCAQCDERSVLRRSRCTVYSRAILNLKFSLKVVADLVLICLVRGWADLWTTVNKVMKLCFPHSAVYTYAVKRLPSR
jgi:hypothetical protein